jgi:hypothetical protein
VPLPIDPVSARAINNCRSEPVGGKEGLRFVPIVSEPKPK